MPNSSLYKRSLLAGASLSFMLAATSSFAANIDQLEEVVVTAQKVEQPLQNVPISVSSIDATQLSRRSMFNVIDIASQVPGVEFSTSDQGGSNAAFYIRGIGQNDFIATTDPGVGVYLDGVYISRTAGAAMDLLDISRIEILRGPQGTLFGKNAIGGAVNIVTDRPNFKSEGKAYVRVGERGRFDLGASVNVPLIDQKLAMRVSAMSKKRDGYSTSLFDGQKGNNEDAAAGRVTFLWLSSDTFDAELSADLTRTRAEAAMATTIATNPDSFVISPQNDYALANGLQPYDNRWLTSTPYQNYSGFHPGDREDIWGTRLTLNWNLDAVKIKSITAYRHLKVSTGLDFDGSPYAVGDQSVRDWQHQFSEELVFSGKSLGGLFDWVGGFYYMKEKAYTDILLMLSYAGNSDGFDTDTTNALSNETYAAYGQGTINITDKLGIVLGGRESHEKKTDVVEAFATKYAFDLVPLTGQSNAWTTFTYRAGLQYKITPDAMIYASVATGFRSGGFNGRPYSVGEFTSAFGPEKATTYEIGEKAEFFDRRFRLNASLYQTDYKGIQETVNVPDPISGQPLNVVENAAKARIKGFEVESTALLTKFLTLNLGVGYMENHYTALNSGTSLSLNDKLPQTPKWTVNAGLDFNIPAPTPLAETGMLNANVSYSFKDNFYQGAQNSPYNYEPSYSLVNARVSYGPEGKGWKLALYGKNLTNKHYFLYREDLYAFGYAEGIPSAPRELGGELNFSW
jgi:iron complex outermembrane receptor protein